MAGNIEHTQRVILLLNAMLGNNIPLSKLKRLQTSKNIDCVSVNLDLDVDLAVLVCICFGYKVKTNTTFS